MSKNSKIVIILCFVFVIFSCSVEDTVDNSTEANQSQTMSDLDVPDGFDWNFSEEVEVLLSAQDTGGNPVPGYRVSLYNDSNQLVFSQNTDVNGEINTIITVPESSHNVTLNYANREISVPIVANSVHHQLIVEEVRAAVRTESEAHYPAGGSVLTVMYEDKWPQVHDYDFNDMVVEISSSKHWHDDGAGGTGYLDSLLIYAEVIASGASYKNGFSIAYHCQDIMSLATISCKILDSTGNYVSVPFYQYGISYFYLPQLLIFNFFKNVYEVLPHTPWKVGINTDPADEWYEPVKIKFMFTYEMEIVDEEDIDLSLVNPFIIVDEDFEYEIHIPGMATTPYFDQSHLFNTGDDNGDYTTVDNYSWGLMFVGQIEYPTEFTDIVTAYPQLADYFAGSGGADWYDHPVANGIADGKVYDRPDMD